MSNEEYENKGDQPRTLRASTLDAPTLETPPRRMSTFSSSKGEYASLSKERKGEFDLNDYIEPEKYEQDSFHNVIRIRYHTNDKLFPFHAPTFITWFYKSPFNPLTREPLSYLRDRIKFKERCMKSFADRKTSDITPAYLDDLIERFGAFAFEQFKNIQDEKYYLECEAFLDLATFESHGYVWTSDNMDYQKTQFVLGDEKIPPGSWLLRKSSQHHNLMPNAEMVVIAYKRESGKVVQIRLVNVYGVGWYSCDGNVPLSKFLMLGYFVHPSKSSIAAPDYLSICHVIRTFVEERNIVFSQCVKPSD